VGGVQGIFKLKLFKLFSAMKNSGVVIGLLLCKHVNAKYSGTMKYKDTIGGEIKFEVR
jgi:hypothetical protein